MPEQSKYNTRHTAIIISLDDNYMFQQMLGVCIASLVWPSQTVLGITEGLCDVHTLKTMAVLLIAARPED